MKEARWTFIAGFIFIAIVWTIIPPKKIRDEFITVQNNVRAENIISIEYANREIDRIKKEINTKWGDYNGEVAYGHMNRLFYIGGHLPVDNDKADAIFWRLGQVKMYSANARRNQNNYIQVAEDFIKLRDSDANSWFGFYPTIRVYNFRPVFGYWVSIYPHTIGFAILFFVCLLMRREILLLEFKKFFVFRLILYSIVWPIAIWFYPSKYFVYQVKEGLRWLSWAMSLAISVAAPGIAKAQQKKVYDSDKQNQGLQINKANISDPHKSKLKTVYNIELFSDVGHDRQAFFRVTYGNLFLLNQNRTTTNGRFVFSHVGLGAKFKPSKIISVTATFGPQFTYEKKRIDRTVLFANVTAGDIKNSVTFVNRLSFGHKLMTPFSNRHIQVIKLKILPPGLAIEGEELHSNNKWRELFFGPMINIGKLTRSKGFLEDVYVYPFWDAAKGNFDVRFGYAHTF